MEITWLGHSCFRLRGKEATIIADPYAKGIGYSLGRATADVVTISHAHLNHANAAAIGGSPIIIDGPGEYEVKGVAITGIRTYHDAEAGKSHGKNTVYLYEMEGLVVCHLGDLGHVPTSAQVEAMSNVDVLLVPAGGGTTIGAAEAAEIISLIEPKVVVPMHFRTPALTPAPGATELEPVEKFLRQLSVPSLQAQPKLSATAGNLPEEMQVVLLEYRKG